MQQNQFQYKPAKKFFTLCKTTNFSAKPALQTFHKSAYTECKPASFPENHRMPDNLLKIINGEPVGINFSSIKNWAIKTTPPHIDLQPYLLVHHRAKTVYLEELNRHTTLWQQTVWTKEIQQALVYLEEIISTILEADETTYECTTRQHQLGETCPNRKGIKLPEPSNSGPTEFQLSNKNN